MDRFKMSFNNSGYLPVISTTNVTTNMPSRPASLNAPMIDRVHKAKPGCSACGKKVA
jgi:hypothetical protein